MKSTKIEKVLLFISALIVMGLMVNFVLKEKGVVPWLKTLKECPLAIGRSNEPI